MILLNFIAPVRLVALLAGAPYVFGLSVGELLDALVNEDVQAPA